MTQEEKQLLLKDLCARLPYGVKYKDAHGYKEVLDIWSNGFYTALNTILYDGKPSLYLRPMSSMTEEEINEYHKLEFIHVNYGLEPLQCVLSVNEIDWLNAHHFDYRGLISMGLALEAPEGMYETE